MSSGVLGLIELLFVFGVTLALGVRELLALRDSGPPRAVLPPTVASPRAAEPAPPKDPTP